MLPVSEVISPSQHTKGNLVAIATCPLEFNLDCAYHCGNAHLLKHTHFEKCELVPFMNIVTHTAMSS